MIIDNKMQIADRLKNIKVYALDMDGTIYLDNKLFPFTKEFIQKLSIAGKRFLFITNNSSKNASDYYLKLRGMGLDVERSQIYTSGDATIEYINRIKPGATIYLSGTENLNCDFMSAGFSLVETSPDFVVLGFDLDFNYSRLEKAARFIRNGSVFIATHPDFNCPLEDGDMIPDCGSMSAALTAATGIMPKVIGKPNSEMLEGIMKRANIDKNELCIIGDRLMTDIKMGWDAGIMTVLVLTGEAKLYDLEKSDVLPDLVIDRNIDLFNYFISEH